MAKDLTQQLRRDIADYEYFSLQLDKSTDTNDTAQLRIFLQMVFTDMTAKVELLTLLLMKERMRGEDIFQAFKNCAENHQHPVWKLCAVLVAVCHLCALLLSVFMCNTNQGLHYSLNISYALCYIKYTQCVYK